MSRICLVCCLVITFLLIATLLISWHKYALDEADRQANIRMLSAFHKDYLRSAGMDKQDYIDQLKEFNKKHSGMLDEYVMRMESEDEGN